MNPRMKDSRLIYEHSRIFAIPGIIWAIFTGYFSPYQLLHNTNTIPGSAYSVKPLKLSRMFVY